MRLAGARVLVTGASAGIGRCVALRCAAAGAQLVLVGRDEQALAAVASRTGGTVVRADVTEPDSGERIAAAAGPVDVLVCAAGVGYAGPFAEMNDGTLGRLIRTNLYATVELIGAVLPAMRSRGCGHVVVLGSIAGRLPAPEEAVYGATKAGAELFAATLRQELAGTGIGVSAVLPAGVDTEFFARRGRPYGRRVPRLLDPDRVAAAVVTAVERDLPEVVLPRWLRVALVVRAVAPRTYDRLSRRLA